MSTYRENWAYEASAHFLPQPMRDICNESLDEIVSSSPIRESFLLSVSANLLERFPSLALDTH
jgi:hypothetical protein